jgi:hypothetical protein
MIAYTISCAKESDCFERIIVSTDDEDIAKTAKAYGAEVPFLRPAKLADDIRTTREVIIHAIETLGTAKSVACLSSVAPLLTPGTLKKACSLINEVDLVIDCLKLETVTPITLQKVFTAFTKPIGITRCSCCPYGDEKAVRYMESSSILICQYPDNRSPIENIWDPFNRLRHSLALLTGYSSFTVTSFSFLASKHIGQFHPISALLRAVNSMGSRRP